MMDFGQQTVTVSRVLQAQQHREELRQLQEDKLEQRRPLPANFAKLSYQKLFYQSHNRMVDNKKVEGNHIAVMRIGTEQQSSPLQAFYSAREIHEKGIKRFKSHYCAQQIDSSKQRRRRGYSIDIQATGFYYLNNWLSNEDYFCQKPPPEQRTANLVYDLLERRWSRALEALAAMPKAPHSATLQYILNGFKAVSNLLAEDQRQLAEHFMGRNTYEVLIMKLSSDSVGGYASFVNVFEEDARAKFHEIRSIPRKVEILKVNLDYLVKFAGAYKPVVEDGYLQLAFKLLGNSFDQEGTNTSPPYQQDYLKLLLRLDLKLSDRLNFAAKLLGQRRRREFCIQLQERLSHFPRLDNILYYTSPPLSKMKEERIELICKSYLDQYLDLQTVAGLAHEFPCLRKYRVQFKQALELSGEHSELERFQNCKWGIDNNSVKQDQRRSPKRAGTFLQCVNVAEQRINDWKNLTEGTTVCEICCKKMLTSETLLQCGKCRHGGHVLHLIKWFEQYENCPHIGCPCLCS